MKFRANAMNFFFNILLVLLQSFKFVIDTFLHQTAFSKQFYKKTALPAEAKYDVNCSLKLKFQTKANGYKEYIAQVKFRFPRL